MERFKVCEKETKTKMFSKEGLALAQKQDPKERARNEMRDWINTTVATLTEQVKLVVQSRHCIRYIAIGTDSCLLLSTISCC